MRLEEKAKAELVKREMEVKRLVRQMEFDKLHRSTVFRNLEQELKTIKHQLMLHDASAPPEQ